MITYAVTSGTLPPGLTLSPEGVLAGTPAQAGPFSGVITATDSEGLRPNATQAFNMTIAEADVAPEITSSAPDAGQVGEAYTHTYTATGSGTITYSVTSGSLGDDLDLSSAGVISGTPTEEGTLTGVVTATNGVSPDDTQAFSIEITEAEVAPEITSSAPPGGEVDEPYTHQYTATGSGTITYSVTSGSLGDDLELSSSGEITGTPTEAGTLTGVVTATNGVSPDDTQAFSIEIAEAPSEDVYTLATIDERYTVPFTYNKPAEPAITNGPITITTGNIGSYTGSNGSAANGRVMTVTSGDYGNRTLNGTDQRWVLQSGAEFSTLTVHGDCARIEVRGESPRDGEIARLYIGAYTNAAEDILFDGVTVEFNDTDLGEFEQSNEIRGAQRLAILNSYFLARDNLFASFSQSAGRVTDFIVANCELIDGGPALGGTGFNGQACVRFMGSLRLIMVDNRIVGDAVPPDRNIRIHAQGDLDSQNTYIAGNQVEGTGHQFRRSGDGGAALEIYGLYYVDNVQYIDVAMAAVDVGFSSDHYPIEYTQTGNTLYGSGGWPSTPGGYSWTNSGNTTNAYQAPPAWDFDTWQNP